MSVLPLRRAKCLGVVTPHGGPAVAERYDAKCVGGSTQPTFRLGPGLGVIASDPCPGDGVQPGGPFVMDEHRRLPIVQDGPRVLECPRPPRESAGCVFKMLPNSMDPEILGGQQPLIPSAPAWTLHEERYAPAAAGTWPT